MHREIETREALKNQRMFEVPPVFEEEVLVDTKNGRVPRSPYRTSDVFPTTIFDRDPFHHLSIKQQVASSAHKAALEAERVQFSQISQAIPAWRRWARNVPSTVILYQEPVGVPR